MKIIDLHCDLLGCVEADTKALNFESPTTNCSVPQLLKGSVQLQTFAVAVLTGKGATCKAERQIELYRDLLDQTPVTSVASFTPDSDKLHGILAIENASGLAEEDEPLDAAFARLERFLETERILYMSLTWNHENRFGGGNASQAGLKPDGEALVEYLSGKGIAIDLSHTSDALAQDLLNLIAKRSFEITPIASHSNYRSLMDVPRNLPDEIAREIIQAGGLIGLNFVRRFVGDEPHDFIRHIHHGLELGGIDAVALGADFYGGFEMPPEVVADLTFPTFQQRFANSSCYPDFFALLREEFSGDLLERLAWGNIMRYLKSSFQLSPLTFGS